MISKSILPTSFINNYCCPLKLKIAQITSPESFKTWLRVCFFENGNPLSRKGLDQSLRALVSDSVLRFSIITMPRWASFRASGNMESESPRKESNLLMMA